LTREDIHTLAGCGASRLVGLDRIRSCGDLTQGGNLATGTACTGAAPVQAASGRLHCTAYLGE